MKVKYIVFDLDDTLLNSERKVSDFTLSTLKKLQELGHFLVINTARSKMYAKEYIDLINPNFSILNGGSLIIDQNKKAIITRLNNTIELINTTNLQLIPIDIESPEIQNFISLVQASLKSTAIVPQAINAQTLKLTKI